MIRKVIRCKTCFYHRNQQCHRYPPVVVTSDGFPDESRLPDIYAPHKQGCGEYREDEGDGSTWLWHEQAEDLMRRKQGEGLT